MDAAETPVLHEAVRHLVDDARRQRGMLPLVSPERRFLLGVDAAALEVLHPELAATRRDGWLEAETPEFRAGYHRTRTLLADVQRRGDVPAKIPIPAPDRRAVR